MRDWIELISPANFAALPARLIMGAKPLTKSCWDNSSEVDAAADASLLGGLTLVQYVMCISSLHHASRTFA